MDKEELYQLVKVDVIRSPEFPIGALPTGSVVTLSTGHRGTIVANSVYCDLVSNEKQTFNREDLLLIEFDFLKTRNLISKRTAVLSLTAATKAFGWIGGIVGAGIASTTVTVQNFIIGGHVPWGTTQTTLATKMGMSVGSLALVSSWIGFGVGVVATPIVYVFLRDRVKNQEEFRPVSIFNQTAHSADVSIIEITNVTISYNCIPSKPEIRTIYTFSLQPGGVVIDIPVPNEETSLFKLCHYVDLVTLSCILIEPFSVYTIRPTGVIHQL